MVQDSTYEFRQMQDRIWEMLMGLWIRLLIQGVLVEMVRILIRGEEE